MSSSSETKKAGKTSFDMGPAEPLSFDSKRFTELLRLLIGETVNLQNRHPQNVPQETLAAKHVMKALEPYTTEKGGPLIVKLYEFVEGRGQLWIEYPGTSLTEGKKGEERVVSFVGSHLDVVFADPKDWDRDPFTLEVDGDLLYGRGTTDCLGHVALLTELFLELGKNRPTLETTVVAVLIADEEVGIDPEVGVDRLMKEGVLDRLKAGPMFWLDCADKQPSIGSGGVVQWKLVTKGRNAHSGFPNKSVNPISLGMATLAYVTRMFNYHYPQHKRELEYGYPCPSSLKPTRVRSPQGSLNQIPKECVIEGDIRLTPFYSMKEVTKVLDQYVRFANATEGQCLFMSAEEVAQAIKGGKCPGECMQKSYRRVLDSDFGVFANFQLPGPDEPDESKKGKQPCECQCDRANRPPSKDKKKTGGEGTSQDQQGASVTHSGCDRKSNSDDNTPPYNRIVWEWLDEGTDGLACDLQSEGFKALAYVTEKVIGECSPLADTGSLPLVADLKKAGYDIQCVGYGVEDAYHADNEYARLSDFAQGFTCLAGIIGLLNGAKRE